MEWDIDGIKYVPGESCPEDAAQNTKDKWNTMNKIYKTDNGKKAIDEMNGEGVMYKVSSETQVPGAGGSYQTNGDGTGGTIYLNGSDNKIEVLSHEMFHGYQDMHGQGGTSIHNEIEAYLFEFSVSFQSGGASPKLKRENDAYNQQVDNMIDSYSAGTMNNLINGFKEHAGVNAMGTYNSYPLRRTNQKNSLIEQFYPLMSR
jgi:hypothetical protein